MRKYLGRFVMATVVLALAVAPMVAQSTQTASEFYVEYRAAFDKAKSVDDILPFMATERQDEMNAVPAAERADMFEMIKMFGALTSVKVLTENVTATDATLTAEGIDSDSATTLGTITLVKEGGAWRLSQESWKQ